MNGNKKSLCETQGFFYKIKAQCASTGQNIHICGSCPLQLGLYHTIVEYF
jgi:hypothetical protein